MGRPFWCRNWGILRGFSHKLQEEEAETSPSIFSIVWTSSASKKGAEMKVNIPGERRRTAVSHKTLNALMTVAHKTLDAWMTVARRAK